MSVVLRERFFELPVAEVDLESAAVLRGELERQQSMLEMLRDRCAAIAARYPLYPGLETTTMAGAR